MWLHETSNYVRACMRYAFTSQKINITVHVPSPQGVKGQLLSLCVRMLLCACNYVRAYGTCVRYVFTSLKIYISIAITHASTSSVCVGGSSSSDSEES